eukprot:1395375-Amorphochlora_amoeboformis.AAC.1
MATPPSQPPRSTLARARAGAAQSHPRVTVPHATSAVHALITKQRRQVREVGRNIFRLEGKKEISRYDLDTLLNRGRSVFFSQELGVLQAGPWKEGAELASKATQCRLSQATPGVLTERLQGLAVSRSP